MTGCQGQVMIQLRYSKYMFCLNLLKSVNNMLTKQMSGVIL